MEAQFVNRTYLPGWEWSIGRHAPSLPGYFQGAVDDLVISSYALSEKEIASLYQAAGNELPQAGTLQPASDLEVFFWIFCVFIIIISQSIFRIILELNKGDKLKNIIKGIITSTKTIDVSAILLIAFTNHILVFFAYGWYAGIDSYSYDAAGLKLVTGTIFDPLPVMFRAPLVPVVKNVLYLIFESDPYLLGILIHLTGVATCLLAWRLGCRFNRITGFILGIFSAGYLPFSVMFHQISSETIYIPLLILLVDSYILFLRKNSISSLVWLVLIFFYA